MAGRIRSRVRLIILLLVIAGMGCPKPRPESGNYAITVGGIPRTFRLFVPSSYDAAEPMPVVIALHGLLLTGDSLARRVNFERLAEEEGFVAVFPDALFGIWMTMPSRGEARLLIGPDSPLGKVDDVVFIDALIDALSEALYVDESRIYACGASYGAMMAYVLGLELSERIAAVVTVGGGLPEHFLGCRPPSRPVSLLLMHGTDDPAFLYDGGPMLDWDILRLLELEIADLSVLQFIGAEATAEHWASLIQANPIPTAVTLPDTDPNDGTTIVCSTYGGGLGGNEVALYTIHGGGHNWPGQPPAWREELIGPTSREIDSVAETWAFFQKHRRR